jgi:threonine dehydrogenase-like Zn-dependent dehydrogenase
MAIVKKIKEPTTAVKVAASQAGATPEDPIDALIIGAGPSGRKNYP